jgi:putative transposase
LCLEHRELLWKEYGESISKTEQQAQLVQFKQDHPRFQDPPAQVLQNVVKRLDRAFQNFFNPDTNHEYPRYKGRAAYRSMTYPQSRNSGHGSFKYRDGEVYLSKLGWVRAFHEDKPPWLDENCKAKTCTVKEDRHGDWWALITFDVPEENLAKPQAEGGVMGVDAGLTELLTLSNGDTIPNPRHLEQSLQKLQREQRHLSRKEQGSNNWHKQREQVAKLHRTIKNQRRDYLHKVARYLAEEYQVVAVEDNLTGLTQGSRAQSVHDAAWGTLFRFLEYKLEEHGGHLVRVNAKHTTSDCHRCGHRSPKPLSQREHDCPECGLTMGRDQNAAREIRQRGIKKLEVNDEPVPTGCGESTPLDTRGCKPTQGVGARE